MITISLCMIVRDEEETIGRCLDTVKDIVDEIIIVDTGSIDKTKDIVSKYTSNIYDFKWIDDFSAARNYSFSKATKDYILWLDADDVILDEDKIKFKYLKSQLNNSVDIVMMKYNLGVDVKGRPLCTYYRERLLKREKKYQWEDAIHEYINPIGNIATVDVAITHRKIKHKLSRNLDIFETMIKQEKKLTHRNYFYYARELNNNARYDEAIVYFEKFLAQDGGFFSNYIDACIDLSKIYTIKGDRKKAIKTLLRCFEFGVPRAEICCELGSQYEEIKDYERAITWYEIATKLNKPENTLGSIIHDTYNYIPYAAISLCYFKLGLMNKAVEYNEKAGEFKPDSQLVISNRKYFEAIIKSAKSIP
ncbi:Tetratricopeptide repeat-containing protein [Clostridium cavendishii DSM 21758]|uniref:Tetratricopeptide repeat-containing protein n=1 Tax=Clostridium cavendishii DSM 21758 TaxID=1121302 RepID=A0A1M6JIX8_9CLOT|nr:glycosyltransferase [Clostridium cavendishii]SHJ46552.1 Tetratricopeptide repeat-containing protein [Clostridium cavendishii DSM 21758]